MALVGKDALARAIASGEQLRRVFVGCGGRGLPNTPFAPLPTDPRSGIPLAFTWIIPAYNETDRLGPTLLSYLPALEGARVTYEVLLFFDGTDENPGVACKHSVRGVRCLEYVTNNGQGGSAFEGFKHVMFPIIACADADGSVPAADLSRILGLVLAEEPAEIASRRLSPLSAVVSVVAIGRFSPTRWHVRARALLGRRVNDAHRGLKAFGRRVLEGIILPWLKITNRTFEVGMLYHVQSAGVPLVEGPVRHVRDIRTRMPILRAILVMFITVLERFVVNVVYLSCGEPPEISRRVNDRFASV